MPNKKDNASTRKPTLRDNPALAIADVTQGNDELSTDDDQSSPNSLQNTSSECATSSASPSANTTGDINYLNLPIESREEPEGKETTPSKSYNVKAEFFFREDSELQSSTEVQEPQSNSSLTDTTRLCLPPTPPVDERRPPSTLAVPPSNLNLPTISLTEDKSVEDPSVGDELPKGTKTKGTLGDAFSKLVVRLSPRREKPSPSNPSPGASISAETSPNSTSGKQKSKKSSPLRFLLGKEKSPKDSPDKKKKSPSKFKSLVENALHPRKNLFPQRSGAEGSDHLCDFEGPPETKKEKPKRSKTYWEDVQIPKDFKKVESVNFSDTTVDSLSTQISFTTDSPMSDTNQEDVVTERDPQIPPIPESPQSESDNDENSDEK